MKNTAFLTAMSFVALIFLLKNGGRADVATGEGGEPQLGHKIYLWTGCGNCHGRDARGAWGGPDLTDPSLLRVRTDENIFDVIKHGRRDTMMGYYSDELADDQIRSIVRYLRDEAKRRRDTDAAPAR
jgi:mono/diheme cytochrome c family protein